MKNSVIVIFAALLLAGFIGCKKSSDNSSSSGFQNGLTLGTGMDSTALILTGVGNTFTSSTGNIYWRLVSETDMAGSPVRMKLERDSSGVFVPLNAIDYPNPQSTGHIMLSSFLLKKQGNYRITGILLTPNTTVASTTFTIQP